MKLGRWTAFDFPDCHQGWEFFIGAHLEGAIVYYGKDHEFVKAKERPIEYAAYLGNHDRNCGTFDTYEKAEGALFRNLAIRAGIRPSQVSCFVLDKEPQATQQVTPAGFSLDSSPGLKSVDVIATGVPLASTEKEDTARKESQ